MSSLRKRIEETLRRSRQFVVHDVWDIEPAGLSAPAAAGVRVLRILHLVVRGFREDQCPLHASALTYTSLMAIVPILALTLWLARGMGGEELLKNQVRQSVEEWTGAFGRPISTARAVPGPENGSDPADLPPDVDVAVETDLSGVGESETIMPLDHEILAEQIRDIVEQAFEKIGNVSFAALGGIGLAILVWMVLAVLGRVEFSFNRVWGIGKQRSIWRKFTDYLSVLFVLPVLILAASSLPLADVIGRFVPESVMGIMRDSMGAGFLKIATSTLMTCLTFTFVIVFMPNTRVYLKSALVGGIVSGLLFIGWLRLCAALQVGVARYGAIYGSFAVVPILLAWVYVSWQIVLFGAELAFATQNYATYKMERDAGKANIQARVTLALAIVLEAARAMQDNARPFYVTEYAIEKRVPVRFLNDIVGELVQTGILAELSESDGRYVLLKSPETIKLRDIVETVMLAGIQPADMGVAKLDPAVDRIVGQTHNAWRSALTDQTLDDLLKGSGNKEDKDRNSGRLE